MSDEENLLLLSEDDFDEDALRRDATGVEATTSGDEQRHEGAGAEGVDGDGDGSARKSRQKVLSKKKLEKLKHEHEMRGIIYISRIPPHMKPSKIRQLLSEYGEVLRVYCTPEDPRLQRERKKHKGNTGKNFTEGWVEFADKRIAKRIALMLNGQQIGGKRRSAYHFDLWCMKYLPKFKWDHLTEQMRYEKAVREQKLANEISVAKRERDFYLSRVDRAKGQAAIQERRKKKGSSKGGADLGAREAKPEPEKAPADTDGVGGSGVKRTYQQRQAKADPVLSKEVPSLPDDLVQLMGAKKKRKVGA